MRNRTIEVIPVIGGGKARFLARFLARLRPSGEWLRLPIPSDQYPNVTGFGSIVAWGEAVTVSNYDATPPANRVKNAGLMRKLTPSRARNGIELRAPIIFRRAPFGGYPAAIPQPHQRRVDRPLIQQQRAAADLLNPPGRRHSRAANPCWQASARP